MQKLRGSSISVPARAHNQSSREITSQPNVIADFLFEPRKRAAESAPRCSLRLGAWFCRGAGGGQIRGGQENNGFDGGEFWVMLLLFYCFGGRLARCNGMDDYVTCQENVMKNINLKLVFEMEYES